MINPRISVITTCFNSGGHMEETIGSILNQKHSNFELIIVDAGSTDNTIDIFNKIIKDKRVQIITSKGVRFYDGLRLGIEKSVGDYIMFMPISDSYASMSLLKTCEKILDADKNISLVHGISIHNDDENRLFFGTGSIDNCPSKENYLPFWLATFFAYSEHSFCVRKSVYLECITKKIIEFENFNKKFKSDIDEKMMDKFNEFLIFTYNFNTRGYLSRFVPEISCMVKIHEDSNLKKYFDSNDIISPIYTQRIKKYRSEIFSGKINHYFRNGNGEIIGELGNDELRSFIKETFSYRMYNKIYFGASDSVNIFFIRMLYKTKRTFSIIFRNINYLFYKSLRLFY